MNVQLWVSGIIEETEDSSLCYFKDAKVDFRMFHYLSLMLSIGIWKLANYTVF